ncbi:oxygenase MpaB family protein [Rahnella woolbedingensis]|uniref:oxygenase MpaB family protein n=1 Tax=Rahnella woolbedingensis TaxID=1510574 RepID=UPI001FC9F8F6|nr:oxygenase MpaB family protein [Rahnella woolbedingensis]
MLSISGLALGGIDFEKPAGDPGLFGPDSITWRIHGDFSSMLCGGVSALLLQMLHPLALAGVWDHSSFREDMLGRLRRTSQFISATTFAPVNDANALIEKVKSIHLRVTGTDAYGTPYAASDPDLLVWVHVAEAYSFLQSHLRYRNPSLSLSDQNRYYQEFARVAESLGAVNVPASVAAVEDYLQAMRSQLRCDERTREVVRLLQNAPAPSRLAKPVGSLMISAGIELLPDWAAAQLGISFSAPKRRRIRFATRRIAAVLRWAVRNGSWHRAMRRMGRLN